MTPLEVVANAAHEFSEKLPPSSADRALLFSRRYGFAASAIHALETAGFAIVRKDSVEGLSIEARIALLPGDLKHLNPR